VTPQAPDTRWRATGAYLPNNASKAGLLEETRQFLLTYDQLRNLAETRLALIQGGLPQRARGTRITIVEVIQRRLTRWAPPAWVYGDLVTFAKDSYQPSLAAALLLHVVRQDRLLYDFVQRVVVPRWQSGDHTLVRADVQRFLDQSQPAHPEIGSWSHATREKLAGNVLSILRDYGLLRGRAQKTIIEPVVPSMVTDHLRRLLHAEGATGDTLVTHPDWLIWLWDARRVRSAVESVLSQETSV
jgi:hypothetical protein